MCNIASHFWRPAPRRMVGGFGPPADIDAQMAELVDASDSKSGFGNEVQVRFLFWAHRVQTVTKVAITAAFLLFKICQQFASETEMSKLKPHCLDRNGRLKELLFIKVNAFIQTWVDKLVPCFFSLS